MNWIDISVPLRTGLVHWPGDADVRIERTRHLDRGEGMNLSAASMSLHTGTHMDAPLHFLEGSEALDRMPLDATIGPARVIEIRDTVSIKPEELAPHGIRRGERILFKTVNSARCWKSPEFVPDFVSISTGAARFLADRGIRTVGIDYLSVGSPGEDGDETHRILLGAGIWIIEGLDLSAVEAGGYELICLPLKIAGSDGAPARAILRK